MTATLDHAPVLGAVRPTPPPPAAPPAGGGAGPDVTHDWLGAATVVLTETEARNAVLRLSFRTREAGVQIRVIETYCGGCRRPYEDVSGQPCSAKVNNEHLIGGDQAHRAKRKHPAPLPAGALAWTPARKPAPTDRLYRRAG